MLSVIETISYFQLYSLAQELRNYLIFEHSHQQKQSDLFCVCNMNTVFLALKGCGGWEGETALKYKKVQVLSILSYTNIFGSFSSEFFQYLLFLLFSEHIVKSGRVTEGKLLT